MQSTQSTPSLNDGSSLQKNSDKDSFNVVGLGLDPNAKQQSGQFFSMLPLILASSQHFQLITDSRTTPQRHVQRNIVHWHNINALSKHCFAERPAARYAPYWDFLIFVPAVALDALEPSRRFVRLLHSLAQTKCQVRVVTVSAAHR